MPTKPRNSKLYSHAKPANISVKAIEKIYPNGTVALRNASFDVASETIHGLIGANGAGKSTLIKILSGAIPASRRTDYLARHKPHVAKSGRCRCQWHLNNPSAYSFGANLVGAGERVPGLGASVAKFRSERAPL